MTARASFLALFHYAFADFQYMEGRRGFKLFCFWHAISSDKELILVKNRRPL